MSCPRRIRVFVIDASRRVSRILGEALADQADIEIVGTARNAEEALEAIARLAPDVLALDMEAPGSGGLRAIAIAAQAAGQPAAAMEAAAAGAVEVLVPPSEARGGREFARTLIRKIRASATVRQAHAAQPDAGGASAALPAPLIAIGASTGGTVAIERIVAALAADAPPIAIVQHIPASFSQAFAARLDRLCRMRVREAGHGDVCERGQILIAPGGCHLRLVRTGGRIRTRLEKTAPVCFQRPSVDVLFVSVAHLAIEGSVGVLLTGMGQDGAAGLLAMRRAGAHTIVQDESSCAVFGMPKAAIRVGAAAEVLPLDRIALRLGARA